MRRTKRLPILLAGLATVSMLLAPVKALAAENYVITYRSGDVGSIKVQEYTARLAGAGYATEVTPSGKAVKVTVPAGASVDATAPRLTEIEATEGYFALSPNVWGPEEVTATKNMDFVVDYGVLMDGGVEYTLQYLDAESSAQVAPLYITRANVGLTISSNPPAAIMLSGGVNYMLISEKKVTKTLTENPQDNVFTHYYRALPEGMTLEEIINMVDGGTVYTTQEIDGGTVLVQVGGGNAGGGNAGGNAGGDNGAGAGDQGLVTIEDNNTPLAEGIDGAGESNFDDNNVPLAGKLAEILGNSMYMAALVAVLVAAAVTTVAIVLRKKSKKVSASKVDEEK